MSLRSTATRAIGIVSSSKEMASTLGRTSQIVLSSTILGMTTGAHVRRRLALRRLLAAVVTPKHVKNHLCLVELN